MVQQRQQHQHQQQQITQAIRFTVWSTHIMVDSSEVEDLGAIGCMQQQLYEVSSSGSGVHCSAVLAREVPYVGSTGLDLQRRVEWVVCMEHDVRSAALAVLHYHKA